MKVSEDNLQRIKAVELEMFQKFITICNEQNLIYYLAGGTCLGAVRHKGFIPWDDDIDVIMPRPDYDKFIFVAQKYLSSDLFLQTFETDAEYPNNFAKIRNSRTTFVETSCKDLHMNHGIYIDIFPLDGGGDSFEAAAENLDGMKDLTRRISMTFNLPIASNIDKLKYYLKSLIYLVFGPSVKKAIKKRETMYRAYSYDSSAWVANYGGAWGKKEIMPKSVFGEGTDGLFEGIQVKLPQNYDEYLTRMYGDYMTLPPKEKRVGHHYCTIIDPNRSYIEYCGGIK